MNVAAQVLKYITDRPGTTVYKDDIMNKLDLESRVVQQAVLRFQRQSSIGHELTTVIGGNAWRFTPTQVATSSNGVQVNTGTLNYSAGVPMTQIVREYFKSRPHEVVHIDELVTFTNADITKIRNGINNARQAAPLLNQLETIQPGKSWRYVPARSVSSTPATLPARPTRPDESTEDLRIFEEVGVASGGTVIIIRDPDGNMYRATPMQ